MTWAQVQEIYAAGWTVGNHTQSHMIITDYTDEEIAIELAAARSDLVSHGITENIDHFCYVGGNYSDRVKATVAACGMISARTVAGLAYPEFPFADMWAIKNVKSIEYPLTIAEAKAWVDDIVLYSQVGVALCHGLVETASELYQWSIADFQEFCDYLISSGVRVLTMAQAYTEYAGWTSYKF